MNSKKVKQIRKWIYNADSSELANFLLFVRNKYGSKTQEMGRDQLYKIAKKMYSTGEWKFQEKGEQRT